MDRISAMRNIEEALSDFERGEIDLQTLEDRVTGTLRTYVSDLSDDAPETQGQPYRVSKAGDRSLVVVASNATDAIDRAVRIAGGDSAEWTAERLD